jgi:hypothetical protein
MCAVKASSVKMLEAPDDFEAICGSGSQKTRLHPAHLTTLQCFIDVTGRR